MITNLDATNMILMDASINFIMEHSRNRYWYNIGERHIGLTFPDEKTMEEFQKTEVYEYLKKFQKDTEYSKFLKFAW